MKTPMSSRDLTEAEIAAVNRVLNTPVLSIGPGAHIAPDVHLGGEVTVGQGALVGIGATVMPRRSVGDWSVVGAGACVVEDVPAGETVVGVPARPIRR